MRISKMFSVLLAAVCGTGCHWRPQHSGERPWEISIMRPVPLETRRGEIVEQLYEFEFGGIYEIIRVDRQASAERMADPELRGVEFQDGAITLVIEPVPYGVRLHVSNKLPNTLILDGKRSAMIDHLERAHPVELRETVARYPTAHPVPQEVSIPPRSRREIDLDAILPIHREAIFRDARTPEERGAFMVTEAPLPVFSSGFYLYPSREPDVQRVRRRAFGRVYAVHVEFRSDHGSLGYTFHITPRRFSSGAGARELWREHALTPPVLDTRVPED